MSDPFLGEIRMVGFNFAPRGWAICAGQLLPIAQNNALFALLGTTYGGNGTSTFGLPDYRGRVPTGLGQGPGTANIVQGELAGTPTVTMNITQMPSHNHVAAFVGNSSPVAVSIGVGTSDTTAIANPTAGGTTYLTAASASVAGDPVTINGLFTNTTPATTATLGGAGSSAVIPTGTITVAAAGGNQPFPVTQPYIGINFVIALEGVFPSRN